MKNFDIIIKNPKKIVRILGNKNFFNWMSDKNYLQILYWFETGKKLNLNNPKTYNEKLQWIKLFDRRKLYNILADKYAVRGYVADKIGEESLIPLIGLYSSVEDIPWADLPQQFVLKCTHGSGSNIICSNKDTLDIKETKQKLNNWMKKNWFWFGREWAYKDIKPRIVCEKYMTDESGVELKDYKIFCFDGEPKLIQVDFSRHTDHKRNLYSLDWKLLKATIKRPNDPSKIISKPSKLNEMLEFSKKLSEDIPHARVDFYSINDHIYFGEITLYHGSGFEKFHPETLEEELGSYIKLPKNN